MKNKSWFYVQLRETKIWNVGVEAQTETEAIRKAIQEVEDKGAAPDYTEHEDSAERVKRYVE